MSDEEIAKDDAHIFVTQELERVSKKVLELLENKDIIYTFPPLMPNTSTRIVLKTPKTDSSVRKIWLPKTVALILRKWKKNQDELREFLGDEWHDHNLVVTQQNGRPCEGRILLNSFYKVRERCELPKVVFHSLRHTFAVHSMRNWVRTGKDVYVLLPVLSAYMGHTNLSSTSSYLRLTTDVFPDITEQLEKCYGDIMPKLEEYHEIN